MEYTFGVALLCRMMYLLDQSGLLDVLQKFRLDNHVKNISENLVF